MSRFGQPPKSTPRFGEQNDDDDEEDKDICWKIIKAQFLFKVFPKGMSGSGKLRLKTVPPDNILIECMCERHLKLEDPDYEKKRNGETTVGDCITGNPDHPDDGFTRITFVKYEPALKEDGKTPLDCGDAEKYQDVKGLENFCGGETTRRICKDFPLHDTDSTAGVLDIGDPIMLPANAAASAIYTGGLYGQDLFEAAVNCGAEVADQANPFPPYPKWNVAMTKFTVVECLLKELDCGGDKKVQAALMNKFLNDNYKENESHYSDGMFLARKKKRDGIFPPHDCEFGECDFGDPRCEDDTKDCDEDKGP